jgi:menaquinone-9 beta-reductase
VEKSDLAIIGGGPAGTLAAIEAARRGLRVDIWERTAIMGRKVCGGFLSPEAIPLLQDVIPQALSRGSRIARAELYSPDGCMHSVNLPATAVGLSRTVLDEALWRAASAAGAHCHGAQQILGVRRSEGSGWVLFPAGNGSARARAILIACGRWWKVDGLPSAIDAPHGSGHDWIGAQAHLASLPSKAAVELYFFPGGYCGLAPIEDSLYNACFLVRRRLLRLRRTPCSDFLGWIAEVSKHDALSSRLRAAVQVSPTVATAPVRPARTSSAYSGVLAAGDAAGFLDPFTGDGISMAAYSGRLAAHEIIRGLDGPAPETARNVASRYGRLLGDTVRRSYWTAALLRMLVLAPARFQNHFAAMLPSWVSAQWLARTRWRLSES